MIMEGNGQQAPRPWRYKLTRPDLILAFDAAAKIADYRRYRNSQNGWKRGLTNSLSVPGVASAVRSDVAPYVIGNAGELAACLYLGGNFDDSLRQAGDDGADLKINHARMQVKTRRSDSSHAKQRLSLVRMQTANGRCVAPNTPLVLFAELDVENWNVSLLGWCKCSYLRELPLLPARKGNHLNVEVRDCFLEPVSSLKELI